MRGHHKGQVSPGFARKKSGLHQAHARSGQPRGLSAAHSRKLAPGRGRRSRARY